MKLKDTAFKIDTNIHAICTNPKVKSEKRRKRLMVEAWNAYLGQQERYVQDDKLKSIYLAYMGMVTANIANRLTSDELEQFINVITEDMRNSKFNNWKWRKCNKERSTK